MGAGEDDRLDRDLVEEGPARRPGGICHPGPNAWRPADADRRTDPPGCRTGRGCRAADAGDRLARAAQPPRSGPLRRLAATPPRQRLLCRSATGTNVERERPGASARAGGGRGRGDVDRRSGSARSWLPPASARPAGVGPWTARSQRLRRSSRSSGAAAGSRPSSSRSRRRTTPAARRRGRNVSAR